jgi:signal transduction histidine kinase
MLHSLRFRLPAFFLIGFVIASITATLVTVLLLQRYGEKQEMALLHRQASGLAKLYSAGASQSAESGLSAPSFAAARLEQATGTHLFYAGVPLFPGQISGLRSLPRSSFDYSAIRKGQEQQFSFKQGGVNYVAIAEPLILHGEAFGALIAARPKTNLLSQVLFLVGRMALGLLAGLVVALGLFLYLSRRVTRPLQEMQVALGEIAEGNLDIPVPSGGKEQELKALAESLGITVSRLKESNELARGFLMKVSHELRTPITSIRGHTEALLDGLADGDEEMRDSSLRTINSEAERLRRLVNDLLDLAKLQARRFVLHEEEVPLHEMVTQAHEAMLPEANRRNISFDKMIAAHPVIISDGDRLQQVVMNLLSNAFQWTPDGGLISLALEHDGAEIVLSVEDTGPGIPEEERANVIVPFWSQNRRGTGLGLAICHELIVALGGELRLYSEEGRGSRFTVVLPETLLVSHRIAQMEAEAMNAALPPEQPETTA